MTRTTLIASAALLACMIATWAVAQSSNDSIYHLPGTLDVTVGIETPTVTTDSLTTTNLKFQGGKPPLGVGLSFGERLHWSIKGGGYDYDLGVWNLCTLQGMKTGANGNNAECSISQTGGSNWRIHLGGGRSDEYTECWTQCVNFSVTAQ